MQVRLKKGYIEAPYYGRSIYPGDKWTFVEDKYLDLIKKDKRIEIFKEEKETPPKIDIDNSNNNKDFIKIENVDETINNILNAVWTSAKKQINSIDDIEFLKDKLLPVLVQNEKKKLIEVVQEKLK